MNYKLSILMCLFVCQINYIRAKSCPGETEPGCVCDGNKLIYFTFFFTPKFQKLPER